MYHGISQCIMVHRKVFFLMGHVYAYGRPEADMHLGALNKNVSVV